MGTPNTNAQQAFKVLCDNAEHLRVRKHVLDNGATIIDAGCECIGSIEAGLIITRLCMAGLSTVNLTMAEPGAVWPTLIQVSTSQPLLSCLGCQYAGWNLQIKENDKTYRAMASGPGRIKSGKEKLIQEFGFTDNAESAAFVLEADSLPPLSLTEQIAADCGIKSENLCIAVTPTGSLAGCVQIASRVVEVAMHKAHELKFPVEKIVEGIGTTPLPPPIANDPITAMGRTNDTMLYAGRVHLFVDVDSDQAQSLANDLPSCNSKDYGTPFAELFKQCEYDFFKIDPALFSPACVTVSSLISGKSFSNGKVNNDLLNKSFTL